METVTHTIDDVYDFLSDLFSVDTIFGVLDVLKDFCITLLGWLYTFFFVDLWGTAKSYGFKIIDFLFGKFGLSTFDFRALEYVAGIIFICFAVKLAVSIIRG